MGAECDRGYGHSGVAHGTGEVLGAGSLDAGSRHHSPDRLAEYAEAAVIAGLLVFNATLGFFQEGRAQATLAALKARLALTASVRRDGTWKEIPAAELVPGDTIKLSLGGIVAADATVLDGSILLDQSMLTGESVPIEAGAGLHAFAGALVRRGEATATVTATGPIRSSDGPRNSSVPPMSRGPSKRLSCGWCGTWPMVNGVVIVLVVVRPCPRCRWARSFRSS